MTLDVVERTLADKPEIASKGTWVSGK
jgi:hypothetical protein